MTAPTATTRSTPSCLSCFSGILLGLNSSDNITQVYRTESWMIQQVCLSVSGWTPYAFLILFLWLFAIVFSNFIKKKSGITEHYAHVDADDALTAATLVHLIQFASWCGICSRYLSCNYEFVSCSLLNFSLAVLNKFVFEIKLWVF